jgi:hypothetical protein
MKGMPMKTISSLLLTLLALCLLFVMGCEDSTGPKPENPLNMPYDVVIDPADFLASDDITGNTFFPITPGSTYVYVGENEDRETVRVEEIHTTDTTVVMGVTCVVINAREFEAGELVEDTFDWYAQDKYGNMWYFGEDSREMEGGEIVSYHGSWEAGVAGALPGIIMLAHPIEGMWYRQEYWEDEAEDVGQVLSLNATVNVPFGTFSNCLQTAEWNPLEPGIVEHKFYAPGVGLLRALAVKGESGYEDLSEIVAN